MPRVAFRHLSHPCLVVCWCQCWRRVRDAYRARRSRDAGSGYVVSANNNNLHAIDAMGPFQQVREAHLRAGDELALVCQLQVIVVSTVALERLSRAYDKRRR